MSDSLTKCDVCNSLVDEEDLFCANCGTEAPKRQGEHRPAAGSSRLARHNFECSGCGASMSYDAGAAALGCPFCGSVDMRQKADAKILAPSRVAPFRLDRAGAEAAMRSWLGRGFWRPGNLVREASVVKIAPVYVPYWVFRAATHTYWTADSSHTPRGARGDWFPLSGEHREDYSGLLIGGSGALTPMETSQICPFDLAEGKPAGDVDLENVTVEQFSVPRKYARPLARGLVERMEAAACTGHYVPGRARNVHVNVRIESMSSEPVLLPVWVMAYRYRDKLYRFLINGQTGRAAGKAPVSLAKILIAVGVAILAVLLLMLLLSGILSGALGRGPDAPHAPGRGGHVLAYCGGVAIKRAAESSRPARRDFIPGARRPRAGRAAGRRLTRNQRERGPWPKGTRRFALSCLLFQSVRRAEGWLPS
ncbi:MAG: TFIIB-type zinc ribbon-containing protein [Planctomycetota bacterium]|jgi:predicted RNA-binding Zn-ribbon protein involved in translation (DUF1610 family)